MVKFTTTDLLTHDEIEVLITTEFPGDIAKIIAKSLSNYILFANKLEDRNQKSIDYGMYEFDNEKVLYKEVKDKDKAIEESLIEFTTELIELSLKNLNTHEKENLQLKYKKSLSKITKNNFLNTYKTQLKKELRNKEAQLGDPNLNEIHFLNGYYDFRTGTFQKREKGKHYIVNYLKRDYLPASTESKNYIFKILSQIYPKKEDMNYLLQTFGIALTGFSCNQQTILFNIGSGSAGKTTFMTMLNKGLHEYFHELPSDAFIKKNDKRDKILNSFLSNPCIRVACVNEASDSKIDEMLFKKHADGQIQTTSLYRDGSNDFNHHSKLCFVGNTMPNIKIDTGTARRIDAYTHNSKFVNDIKDVDEENNIYLKDVNILTNYENNKEHQNAFFEILAEYGYLWLSKQKIYPQTENFTETKDIILLSNDTVQDFIDKYLVITKRIDKVTGDRIGRNEMYSYFKRVITNSFLTPQQLYTELKTRGIKFEPDWRCDGNKGCYVGVKHAGTEDYETTGTFEHSIFGQEKTSDNDKYIQEIDDLKKQLDEMKTIKNEMEEMKKEIEKLKKKNDKLTEDKDKYKTKYKESKKDKKEIETDKTIEETKPIVIDIKPIAEVKKEKKSRKKTVKPVKEDNDFDNLVADMYEDIDKEYPLSKATKQTMKNPISFD
jgi:hypothetical protein